jgi:hypothetical protein
MENTIFLLNFREGRIEQIPESAPPRLWDPADRGDPPEELDHPPGFVLAALGTPPEGAEE